MLILIEIFKYNHDPIFFCCTMKERITLTLDESILKQVDARVDGFKVKNRSHAIELLLLDALGQSVPKLAIILAGGKGTRLKPITAEIPKPLLPVHDRPIMEHVLDLFKKFHIHNIVVSVGYKGEKIKDYFGNGKKFNVSISYVEEKEPLGTGGPLHLAQPHITSTFILCNADELKDIDLREMYQCHKEHNALITIALTTVSDPSAYGVARLSGNKILEFIEKPKKEEAPSKLISAGLYMVEPEVLSYVPRGAVSLERDVFPKIAAMGRLYGYPFGGQWFDTGTLDRYEEALKKWKDLV